MYITWHVHDRYLEIIDAIFLGVYMAEAVVKITVYQKFYFLDKLVTIFLLLWDNNWAYDKGEKLKF